ncbi:unnamed protein product [Rotaria sp. Silwood1]|nr:unnamed protein product [Rotaria sp. Silwood1]CAF4624752.1 unnamed protein product [Rotaria sp. Silwood1]
MNDLTDTLSILSLEDWNATDTGVLSHIKTPIQNTFFSSNSDLIGKALRQSIIYFAETLNIVDRSSCIFGNEFRSTRTHKCQLLRTSDEKTSETTTIPIEITTYAPIAFEYMRTVIGITRNDFQTSFNCDELINFANTGRSGSQMYKTADDVYIIKTVRDHEAKLLIRILSGLYLYYSHTPSLMTRYVGLYSVNMGSKLASEIYCIVMLNNLPSFLDINEIYDLKGSKFGRYSSVDLPVKRLKALKDLDFELFYPYGIRIPHDIYRRLRLTLESDICELRKMMITDFSLILGVYQLDEHIQNKKNNEQTLKLRPKPQLGLSALFAATNIDRTLFESSKVNGTNKTENISNTKLINKFIMKPLHLIACPQEDTFSDDTMATAFLGIPGVTHDGKRVLLYPAIIDCLQTFDNFKRMQHTIQNIRDRKRSSEYSVIHPDEYEKRLIRFLFDKVLIDSKQTLNELLASPILCNTLSEDEIRQMYENQNQCLNAQRESFEIIQTLDISSVSVHNEPIIQTNESL